MLSLLLSYMPLPLFPRHLNVFVDLTYMFKIAQYLDIDQDTIGKPEKKK